MTIAKQSLLEAAKAVVENWYQNKEVIDSIEALRQAVQAEPEKPVAYITQAALDALKRGASSSVRVWRNPDEPNGDIALYAKENCDG